MALVKLPRPSPLHQRRAGGVYGKILDTLRRGQGSLDFCFLSTALQPRTAKSDSQEQMQGRCAGHQLKLGPLLPVPGALRRTVWREAAANGQLLMV